VNMCDLQESRADHPAANDARRTGT